jgi:hypothetical protein
MTPAGFKQAMKRHGVTSGQIAGESGVTGASIGSPTGGATSRLEGVWPWLSMASRSPKSTRRRAWTAMDETMARQFGVVGAGRDQRIQPHQRGQERKFHHPCARGRAQGRTIKVWTSWYRRRHASHCSTTEPDTSQYFCPLSSTIVANNPIVLAKPPNPIADPRCQPPHDPTPGASA